MLLASYCASFSPFVFKVNIFDDKLSTKLLLLIYILIAYKFKTNLIEIGDREKLRSRYYLRANPYNLIYKVHVSCKDTKICRLHLEGWLLSSSLKVKRQHRSSLKITSFLFYVLIYCPSFYCSCQQVVFHNTSNHKQKRF